MINLQNKINVVFPKITYQDLAKEITKFLNQEITEFLIASEENYAIKIPGYLTITYDYYTYDSYDSYVFYIESFVFGAHPDHKIVSFTYDTLTNKIITIDTLLKKDPFILNYLSTNIRKQFANDKRIVDKNMFLEGTKPVSWNYQVFALTPRGILVFFPPYQIAPYSEGSFKNLVSYRNNDFLKR